MLGSSPEEENLWAYRQIPEKNLNPQSKLRKKSRRHWFKYHFRSSWEQYNNLHL